MREEIILGLDLGSSQITAVCGQWKRTEKTEMNLEILAGTRQPTKGIRGGVVVDIKETRQAIEEVVKNIENQIETNIRTTYLALRGQHIQSQNSHGTLSINRADREITEEDVKNVIENAKSIRLSHDREILHSFVQDFSVDHQSGVANPVGMDGSYLDSDVHIITVSTPQLNNIIKSIGGANLDVVGSVYGIIALAEAVATPEEKDMGCLVIDFGGATTGVVIFANGSIRYSREIELEEGPNQRISIGMDLITRDILSHFRMLSDNAVRVKEKYGVAMPELVKRKDETFEYNSGNTNVKKKAHVSELAEVIAARLDMLLDIIIRDIKHSGYWKNVESGGIIVTGGGAKLLGIVEAVEKAFNVTARLGLPLGVSGVEEIIKDPSYATAISLLQYQKNDEEYFLGRRRRLSFLTRFFRRLGLEDIF